MQPLVKPWEELERARVEMEKMRKATDLNILEEHWRQFLHRLERAWNKSVSHLKRSPKYQGWVERGRVQELRRNDPFLCYLVNARGADEHTIEDIVGREEGYVGINPAEGNYLHIKSLTINNGIMKIDSDQPLRITFKPARAKLVAVTNRGRRYDPPTQHLGNSLSNVGPLEASEMAICFYENYFRKAEQFFVRSENT
jgi:hypothetical protein